METDDRAHERAQNKDRPRGVSNSMRKTIIVVTESRTAHATYGKIQRRSHALCRAR